MTIELVSLTAPPSPSPNSAMGSRTKDVSGFGVFSGGDAGQAHVMAHRTLDEGRHELGHRWLGHWLATHDGQGSDWTHLQWHMAIFELALGQWDAALHRFDTHILPVATATNDALTDAPAMLWHLWLHAERPVVLPWEPVRATAARELFRVSDPYVALHCLLALAGAGDMLTLDRWIEAGPRPKRGTELLSLLALGLRSFAAKDYRSAAAIFGPAVARASELGGSRAQNELFRAISELSWKLSQRIVDQAA